MSRYRGANVSREPKTLTALVWCEQCQIPMVCGSPERGRNYRYIRCKSSYRPSCGKTIHFDDVEDAVIDHLMDWADLLIERASEASQTERLPNPEVERIEGQIRQLRKFQLEMGDEEKLLEQQIGVLHQKIANLQSTTPNQAQQQALRQELSLLVRAEPWQVMTDSEKRAVFLRFIDRVIVDLPNKVVTVKPSPFLRLSD
ncbi:hypothetical protein NC981_10230 [Leptolyngbya sp. DQ-M1]|uniref:FlxA-like family protein n=1 Tax=Leptolyngbya sp. DQ-M1 TaxID=2933920 RepID=UPI00329745D9